MKFLKISLALLVPLLLLACVVFLTTGASSYKVYVIHTGSMSPTIPSGSAVLVHEGHYRIGQVITFTEDGLVVTHRLISISAEGLTTTKGDANSTNDPWHVPTSQIIGGVVIAPRYVGYAIMYLKSPLGLASVFLAVLLIWQVGSLMRNEEPSGEDPDQPASRHSRRARARTVPLAFGPSVPESEASTDGSLPEMGGFGPADPVSETSAESSLAQTDERPHVDYSWLFGTTLSDKPVDKVDQT